MLESAQTFFFLADNTTCPIMSDMLNLPVDLVLVRHGESEGNLYDRLEDPQVREKLHTRYV